MGFGDELQCSGIARGAKARGKRIAFGDGETIRWHPYARQIFQNNPNVAAPGQESAADIEWVENYAGKRPYLRQVGDRWLFYCGYGNRPGEVFFDDAELRFAETQGSGFVLMEPNVPAFKKHAVNKQWPLERYEDVADRLVESGLDVAQFHCPAPHGPGHQLRAARQLKAPNFRHALAVLSRAALYVGPEGGLHHGAAAVGIPAVVIFGGFIAPEVTGYATHANLFVGDEGCGSLKPCAHCRLAMAAITTDHVIDAAMGKLSGAGG